MAPKAPTKYLKPTPKGKGTFLGDQFEMDDGKIKRVESRKTSVSQKIAKRKKPPQKYTRTQRP